MEVEIIGVSKAFQDYHIFKNVDIVLPAETKAVVLGANGSGKSTLLKIISGAMMPSKGRVVFSKNGQPIASDKRYQEVSFCAPYIDLIEDFTLNEHIVFQQKFKPFQKGLSTQEIIKILYLSRFADREIKTFSSGMKQRVRLALAVLADASLLLLDEPTSNLDAEGKGWYKSLIENWALHKTIVVGSNHQPDEYFLATQTIQVADYK
jgi:ABC-type multidrug transport system ATPase subunit